MFSFTPILLSDSVKNQDIFWSIIIKLNLNYLFPLQVVKGFVQYFTFSKLEKKINKSF
jgi:hypothetical protein